MSGCDLSPPEAWTAAGSGHRHISAQALTWHCVRLQGLMGKSVMWTSALQLHRNTLSYLTHSITPLLPLLTCPKYFSSPRYLVCTLFHTSLVCGINIGEQSSNACLRAWRRWSDKYCSTLTSCVWICMKRIQCFLRHLALGHTERERRQRLRVNEHQGEIEQQMDDTGSTNTAAKHVYLCLISITGICYAHTCSF